MKRKQVLWIGDGVKPTGFSTVNHNIIKNVSQDKYDIHHLAINYWGDPNPYENEHYHIYPASNPQLFQYGDLYGYGRVKEFANKDIDLIFILNDVMVVNEYLKEIKKVWKPENLPKIVVYFPVDGGGYTQRWFENFDIVSHMVVYTEYGKQVVLDAFPTQQDILKKSMSVIPHGTNKEDFFIIDKVEARKAIYQDLTSVEEASDRDKDKSKLVRSGDAFIVFSGERNQPRKRLDLALMAFALFAHDKDDVFFHIHAGRKDAGWFIDDLITRLTREHGFNLLDKIIYTSNAMQIQDVPVELLNQIHNACDVAINTSTGEGWGLLVSQNASLGKPVVVPNHTVMSELYGDCGLLADVSCVTRDQVTLLERYFVDVEHMAEKLQTLYDDKKLYKELSENGIKKFSEPHFMWDNIGIMWDRLFDKLWE